jgi:hypothetical protein
MALLPVDLVCGVMTSCFAKDTTLQLLSPQCHWCVIWQCCVMKSAGIEQENEKE